MKFLTYCALVAAASASVLSRHHHHHPAGVTFVSTLPDVRADTVSDEDIAAHEAARAEAAKVKKNPQLETLTTIKLDLDQISKDLSFGVSYSQQKRNDHATPIDQANEKIEEKNRSPSLLFALLVMSRFFSFCFLILVGFAFSLLDG